MILRASTYFCALAIPCLIANVAIADTWATNIGSLGIRPPYSPGINCGTGSNQGLMDFCVNNISSQIYTTAGPSITATLNGTPYDAQWYGFTLSGSMESWRLRPNNALHSCAVNGCGLSMGVSGTAYQAWSYVFPMINTGCRSVGLSCNQNSSGWVGNSVSVSSSTIRQWDSLGGMPLNYVVETVSGTLSTPTWVLIVDGPTGSYTLPGGTSVTGYRSGTNIPFTVGLNMRGVNSSYTFAGVTGGASVTLPVPPIVEPDPVACNALVGADISLGTVDSSTALGASGLTTLIVQCTDDATVRATVRASNGPDNIIKMGGLTIPVTFGNGLSTGTWPATNVTPVSTTINAKVTVVGALVPGEYSTSMIVNVTYD